MHIHTPVIARYFLSVVSVGKFDVLEYGRDMFCKRFLYDN